MLIRRRLIYDAFHIYIDNEPSYNYIDLIVPKSMDTPQPRFHEYDEVLGRNGRYRKSMNTFDEVKNTYEIYFLEEKRYEWGSQWRRIKNWLLSFNVDGKKHKFKESTDLEWFKYISKISIDSIDREVITVGKAEVTFIFDPFDYAVSGTKEYDINDVLFNPYWTCEPVFKVMRNGSHSIFDIYINDNKFTIKNMLYEQPVYIDVPRRLTYHYSGSLISAHSRAGQEEDCMMVPKMNRVRYTDGYKVKVIPNWRSV